MALVAYDNSDSSEYEDEENENTTVTLIEKPEATTLSTAQPPKNTAELGPDEGTSIFNFLPQPSTKKPAVVEEDDEFLHKKESVTDVVKPKAKITVPSLSDFKDVDSPTPIARPKATNGKKSSLLSILPQPKNGITLTSSKSLIPHVLTQKPNNANVKKKTPLPSPMKKQKTDSKITDYSDESDNDNDDVENDFFSINKPEVPIPDVPVDLSEESKETSNKKERPKLESFFKKDPVEQPNDVEPEPMDSYEDYASGAGASYSGYVESNGEAAGSSNGEVVLDEEAILKLCGTRGKRKREDIQIVDVNQQEVLADAREWLLKGLMDDTSKRVSSSKKRGNEPTSQQKRKHQITYLAHQAKANEAELQNQWANSRMSRRATQNKYGF